MGILTVEEIINARREKELKKIKKIKIDDIGEIKVEPMTAKEVLELIDKETNEDILISKLVYMSVIEPKLNDSVLLANNNLKVEEAYRIVDIVFGDLKYSIATTISELIVNQNVVPLKVVDIKN